MAVIGSAISQGRDHRDAWALLGVTLPDSMPDIGRRDMSSDALECLCAARAAGLVLGARETSAREGAEAALTAAHVDVDVNTVAASATWGVAKPTLEFF